MDLREFIEIEETKESILEKLEFLKSKGLSEYLEFAVAQMGIKRLPSKNYDSIIEQIIAKSPNDLNDKVKSPEHYKAHLCCMKQVWEEMFLHDEFIDNFRNHQVESEKDITIYNYYHLLHDLLFDMVLLIQDYNFAVKNISSDNFSVGRNLHQGNFSLYQLIPQTIFGQSSYHSYIELEPNVSIALIRQVIELKIRNAFGIMGSYDSVKDSYEPLPLGQIFDELKKHKDEIDLAVPLANIIRINGWANIFMHSGMKDYTWTLIFVYRYLHYFIKGRTSGNSWSINSGIRLKQTTLDNIINGIEQTLKSYNPNLEIYKTKPDVSIICNSSDSI